MLALWLSLLQVVLDIASAIVSDKGSVVVLDHSDAVRLTCLLGVLHHLYRSCRLFFLVDSTRLAQTLLFEKSLVASKLAEDKVLVSVPFIFLN